MAAVMASPASSVRAGAGLRLLRAAVFTAVCVVLAAAGHTLASGRTVPGTSLLLGWLAVFAVVAPLAGRERSLPGIAALLAVGQVALHAVFNVGQACAGLAAAAGTPPGVSAGGLSSVPGTAPGASSGDGGLAALAARLVCGSHGHQLTPGAARAVVSGAGLDPASGAPAQLPDMRGMLGMSGMPDVLSGGAGRSPLAALPFCSLPMLLGHLLAAVVAGWLLRRGEAALWRLIRLSLQGAAALSPAAVRRAHALLSVLAARAPYTWPRVRRAARTAVARRRTVWLRHSLARRGPPVLGVAA